MERYEFTATTAKSDIIIGILFPHVPHASCIGNTVGYILFKTE